jgi:hypothetical protein
MVYPLTIHIRILNMFATTYIYYFRNVATKMAAKTVNWLIEQLTHVAARDGETLAPLD